jgi:hypothetical protein
VRVIMQEGTEFAALAADQVTRAEEFDLKVVDQIAEDCAAAARVLEMITDAAIEQWLSDTSAFLEERRRQRPKEMLDRGRLQMKQGRHGEAEAAYRDAIASDHPDHAPAAMVYLGELLQGAADTWRLRPPTATRSRVTILTTRPPPWSIWANCFKARPIRGG